MRIHDRVLVIGGSGLIGSNFLLRNTCVDMNFTSCSRTKLSKTDQLKISNTTKFVQADWFNVDLTNYDAVFFFAGEIGQFDAKNESNKIDYSNESARFKFFLERINSSAVNTFVFASSAGSLYSEIGEGNLAKENYAISPITMYGKLKYEKEELIHQILGSSKLKNCVILRLSNVYGGYLFARHIRGAIPNFIKSIVNNQPIKVVGNPSNTRDFIHVEDVVRALQSILHREIGHKILNLSSGIGLSLQSILDLIYQIAQSNQYHFSLDTPKFDEYLGVNRSVVNNELISNLLNWIPKIDIRNGLETSFKDVEKIFSTSN
jgi:UDP-glucose 4-epimerase